MDAEDLKFTPAANGKEGKSFNVKRFYYPKEYRTEINKERSKYDIGVLELGEDVSDQYGYIGIDSKQENPQETFEAETYGYPGDKPYLTMWDVIGTIKE